MLAILICLGFVKYDDDDNNDNDDDDDNNDNDDDDDDDNDNDDDVEIYFFLSTMVSTTYITIFISNIIIVYGS